MRKKFELTNETKTLSDGTVLHRIRAVRDFVLVDGTNVLAGDLGGWIEREDNLSQFGKAWVGGDAEVSGNAEVSGKANIFGNAEVFGKAVVRGNAEVFGEAAVFGNAEVFGEAAVFGNACVRGKARVFGNAEVFDRARIFGNAEVFGNASVCGDARIRGFARVCGIQDYAIFKNEWSSGRWFTYTRSDKMWTVGCFHGTGDELIARAYRDSELSGRCYEIIVRAQEAIDKAKAHANNQEKKKDGE